jgi:hypothetical protein
MFQFFIIADVPHILRYIIEMFPTLRPKPGRNPRTGDTQAEENDKQSGVDKLKGPFYRTTSASMLNITGSRTQVNSQIKNMGLDPNKYKKLTAEKAMRMALADRKALNNHFMKARQAEPLARAPPLPPSKMPSTTSPLKPVDLSASSAPISITPPKPVIPSSATSSPSTVVESNTPLQLVAPTASSALSITPATAHTPHTKNVPDMFYVTYENKTYPVHVEQSSRSREANGGTRKHNSNKRKTRKRLH